MKRAAKAKKTASAGPKAKSPPKAGAKAKPGATEAKPIKVRKGEKVAVVLAGGNPRIAKADGETPGVTATITELKRSSGGTVLLKFVITNLL